MNERLKAIEVNLRILLGRVEGWRIDGLTYEVIAKLQDIELKIDQLNDLLTELDAIVND